MAWHDRRVNRTAVEWSLVGILAGGCTALVPSSPPPPTTSAAGISLRATTNWPTAPATPPACAGVGLDAVLHGDAGDPAVAWITDRAGAGRIEVIWPPGYLARFSPRLVVVDPTGAIVHREGDAITGGCVEDGGILLDYP